MNDTSDLDLRLARRRAFYLDHGLDVGDWFGPEEAFMRWAWTRGAMEARRGSAWWRAVNEALIADGAEAAAMTRAGTPAVVAWRAFLRAPTARAWHLAHERSIAGAARVYAHLLDLEPPDEQRLARACLTRLRVFSRVGARLTPSAGAVLVRGVVARPGLYPRVYPAPPPPRRVRAFDALVRVIA